jgi:Domain of unknown function (DUF3846)
MTDSPGRLTIVRPNGSSEIRPIEREPALKLLNEIVGGYIEEVPGFVWLKGEPCVAFCNEEGKLQGLPYNEAATKLWRKAWPLTAEPRTVQQPLGDHLVGNVAIITGSKILREMREP